jgi:hypothetical protein
MHILKLVTVDTGNTQFFSFDRPGVTTGACHLLMLFFQGKGCFLMVKCRGLPAFAVMTLGTVRTIEAFVSIIFFMAGETISFQFLAIKLLRMTEITSEITVFPFEGKPGLAVLKSYAFPGSFRPDRILCRALSRVAILTFLAIAAGMGVIKLMAAVTIRRDLLPVLIGVTEHAA